MPICYDIVIVVYKQCALHDSSFNSEIFNFEIFKSAKTQRSYDFKLFVDGGHPCRFQEYVVVK